MNRRKQYAWIAVATIAIVILAIALSARIRSASPSAQGQAAQGQAAQSQAVPAIQERQSEAVAAKSQATPATRIGVASGADTEMAPPEASTLRAEVEKNPHVTPKSLIAFAASLAPRMDSALSSEAEARKFWRELEDCIRDPKLEGAHSTQAICLSNARLLGEKYPELGAQYKDLAAQANPVVRRLAAR